MLPAPYFRPSADAALARAVRSAAPPLCEDLSARLEFGPAPAAIGRGGYGHVVGSRLAGSDRPLAVKLLPLPLEARRSRAVRELRFMARLRGVPHVAELVGYAVLDGPADGGDGPGETTRLGLVTARMPTDLRRALTDRDRDRGADAGMGREQALRVFLQVALAVAGVHAAGVVHADVKPSNVLYDPATGAAALTDMGTCFLGGGGPSSAESSATARPAARDLTTLPYRAPEGLYRHCYGYGSDVWGLGLLLCELLMGRVCYVEGAEAVVQRFRYGRGAGWNDDGDGEELPHLLDLQRASLGEHRIALRAGLLPLCPSLRSLAVAMLALEPRRRPSAAEVARRVQGLL